MAIFTSAGIAAALSTTAGFFTAATAFVLNTAVGVGVSLLGQAISGRQGQSAQNFAINGTLQGGGDLARSFIIGRYSTAGSLVWVNTWGSEGNTPNAYLTQVIALSDLPVAGLAEFWVNGEKVELGGEGAYGRDCIGTYAGNLWVRFHDGNQTVADGVAIGATNGARSWESTRLGVGISYAVVTARVAGNKFSGVPSFKFVLDGRKLYDISKDSSAGGNGPQRWEDVSTWGGDGDHLPAVQLYNVLRGINFAGRWFYGLQNLPAARLPAANWIAQINKCRASIQSSSGVEPTYRSGGEITVDAPLTSAVEALLTACHGKISEVGGVYSLHCGSPDGPVISFTDDDILSTEEQEFTPFLGLADTINGVAATYPSPSEGWVTKTAPPLYRTDLEAQDGNRRLMADVPLSFVPYAEQVQRLMKSALEEARRFRRHTIVLPPEFWAYAVPGVEFEWTSVRNGYVNKLMRLDGVVDRSNLDVMIDITEVDPSDYDWNSGTEFQPPVSGAVGVIYPTPQPIIDWFAEASTIKDNAGDDRRPAIRLTWDNSDGRLDDVAGVEYEVRLPVTFEKVCEGRTDQPQAGSMLISQGLLPNTTYLVRGRYIPASDRVTLWSGYISVLTPNILLSDKDVFIDVDLDQIEGSLAWLRHVARTSQDAVDQILASIMEGQSVSFLDKQTLRRELAVSIGAARAEYREEIQVAVNATSAVATKVENLTASLGGSSAQVNIAWAAAATAEGYAASYQLQAAVNDGQFRAASFGLNVPVDPAAGSQILMDANQIILRNGPDQARPFVMQDSILYLDEVKVNTLSALSSTLGNVDIGDANIERLIVKSSNIEPGAATRYDHAQRSGDLEFTTPNLTTILTVSTEHGSGSPIVELLLRAGIGAGTGTTVTMRIFSQEDNSVVYSQVISSGGVNAPSMVVAVHSPPATRALTTYHFQISSDSASTKTIRNSYLRALALRR